MRPKAIAALLIFLVVVGPISSALGAKRQRYLYVVTYTFENRGDEPYVLEEDDATIPLFYNNSWQTVRILNATHAVNPEDPDVDGNRLAVLDLPPEIPPRSSLAFSVAYEIESTDRPKPKIDPAEAGLPSDIPQKLVEGFCLETETFTLGDEEVRALALRLAAEETTVLGVVTRFLDWFIANVSYRTFEVPRYPNETLARGNGDCDDQAILLATMCRILGIPALLQVGCLFHEDLMGERDSWGSHLHIEQRGLGWHGWASVYIPPWGWLPIDLTLITSQDALSRITEAPVYKSFVVTCLNVSRQEYVGDSRRAREELMSSDLYITMSEKMAEGSPDAGWTTTTLYLVLGIVIASAVVFPVILLIGRRSQKIEEDRS